MWKWRVANWCVAAIVLTFVKGVACFIGAVHCELSTAIIWSDNTGWHGEFPKPYLCQTFDMYVVICHDDQVEVVFVDVVPYCGDMLLSVT